MNTITKSTHGCRLWTTRVLLATLFLSTLVNVNASPRKTPPNVKIVAPGASFNGKSYSQWAASFWQWMMALPLQGHPALDDPSFVFRAGQSGPVWYWAAPDGPITRTVTLPAGKALFLTIRDVETSTLEDPPFYGATEAEQRANSTWFADHIVDVFCVIDGTPVPNLQAYRFSTPQFSFSAPTPWIFGSTGGTGTSVGDGYFLMLTSFSPGVHTIHYGGTFHFDAGELDAEPLDFPHDVTIQLTVPNQDQDDQEQD